MREQARKGYDREAANKLDSDMFSDMSYFASEKGLSELTSASDHERFYNKWEKVISSGMVEDHRFLNPMAVKILP